MLPRSPRSVCTPSSTAARGGARRPRGKRFHSERRPGRRQLLPSRCHRRLPGTAAMGHVRYPPPVTILRNVRRWPSRRRRLRGRPQRQRDQWADAASWCDGAITGDERHGSDPASGGEGQAIASSTVSPKVCASRSCLCLRRPDQEAHRRARPVGHPSVGARHLDGHPTLLETCALDIIGAKYA